MKLPRQLSRQVGTYNSKKKTGKMTKHLRNKTSIGYWKANRAKKIIGGVHDRRICLKDFPKEMCSKCWKIQKFEKKSLGKSLAASFSYFEGVAKSRMTLSIDRPGKGIERGLRTRTSRGLTWPDVRERRASLASKSATGTLPMQRAARPPRAFTHISNSKLSFFQKITLFSH